MAIDCVIKSNTKSDTPQHNPFAEEVNCTIPNSVRKVFEQCGFSTNYWLHAVDHAIHVKNSLPDSAFENCSPFEKLTTTKLSLNHAGVYRCAAFVYKNYTK